MGEALKLRVGGLGLQGRQESDEVILSSTSVPLRRCQCSLERYSTSSSPRPRTKAASATKQYTRILAFIAHSTSSSHIPRQDTLNFVLTRRPRVLAQANSLPAHWISWTRMPIHMPRCPLLGRSSSCILRVWVTVYGCEGGYDCGVEHDADGESGGGIVC